MGANEEAGFNSISCHLFSQSHVHSEIITCTENRPFKTVHLAIEDQSGNSQLPTEKPSDLISFEVNSFSFWCEPRARLWFGISFW